MFTAFAFVFTTSDWGLLLSLLVKTKLASLAPARRSLLPSCTLLAAPRKSQIVTNVVQLQASKKAILSDLPISTLRNAPVVHSGNVGLRHQAISGFRFPTHSSIDRFSVYSASAASTRSGRYRLLH
jgi:hypothetical protein